MSPLLYSLIIILAGQAVAKRCINMTVPVHISARNAVFDQVQLQTNQDVAAFTSNLTSISGGNNYTEKVLNGYTTVSGKYDIDARYCFPDQSNNTNITIQVLTHGVGFDKAYWDFPFNNFNYSYIDRMVDGYGYHTLSYDRLGIGNSSKADPYSIIQAQAEISALYYMSQALRNGTFPGVNLTFDGRANKIVHVGHSYGSQQSYQLTVAYPNISDALVLTGFSFNGTALDTTFASLGSKIARQNQPFRFGSTNASAAALALSSMLGPIVTQYNITVQKVLQTLNQFNITTLEAQDIFETTELNDLTSGLLSGPYPVPQDLPLGYLTWSDVTANQYNFFYQPGCDKTIIWYAETVKQPYTVGELLTMGVLPSLHNAFTGPVQIITGQQDAIFCAGDCLATGQPNVSSIIASAGRYFPRSRRFESYVQPRTGHALNMHYNSTAAYDVVADFLSKNGVAPDV